MARDYPQLDLTYAVDFNDLFSASAVLWKRRYPAGKRWKLTLIGFAALVIGGVLSATLGYYVSRFSPIPAWLAIIAFLGMLWVFYTKALVPWMSRQSASIVNAIRPPGPMRCSTDEQGLRWQDADIDFRLNWTGVEAMFCTDSAIAFMSGVIALVLPFSAFPSPAARRDFIIKALACLPKDAAEKSRKDPSIQQALTV